MLTANNKINGFRLRNVILKGKFKGFKIEYLIDGEYVGELGTTIVVSNLEQERELREELLKRLQKNLDVKTEVDEYLRIENQKPLIGAINGFMLKKEELANDRIKATITFFKSGYESSHTVIEDTSESAIKEIVEMLKSNTKYNLGQSQECRVINLVEFLVLIENIVQKYK